MTQRYLRKESWVELLKGTCYVLTCSVTWCVETVVGVVVDESACFSQDV